MKRKELMEQLRGMSLEELKQQEEGLRESLFRLRFRKSLGFRETIKDIRREKKILARVLTLINQLEKKQAQNN
jgi:ribosomal protein L29